MSDIFIYNPTGEIAIANGMISYMPPKKLRSFESDLAFLTSFFASDNDIILSPQLPNPQFLELWHSLGLEKMRYISSLNQKINNINYVKPWSWNPVIHHKTKHLKEQSATDFKASPNYSWKEGSKAFFSRNTTNKVQSIISQNNGIHPFIEIPHPAISISTLEDFKQWMRTQTSAILKMPWSSSGRGIHVIDPQKQLPLNYPWIQGALQRQGFITQSHY
ncbi:hypothetical protein [Saccharicrinis fermentans]|uniref:Uncharacterized protein n=1 Tax=Saccharicrinis fermentans DSM 9555 = JCM 21142 TaxID=869213 RepID=W7Y048_9BACT|nr:hypothetical protein [Saccharicrinis fermentans]GAF04285.1 hypothetical protein JCM21142_72982 [Saccharicrinis fermentans DSM 9555 = JCM 21142]